MTRLFQYFVLSPLEQVQSIAVYINFSLSSTISASNFSRRKLCVSSIKKLQMENRTTISIYIDMFDKSHSTFLVHLVTFVC